MDASSARPSLLVDVWSSHSGSVHFPRLEGLDATESCDAILAAITPQCAVAVEDPTVRDRLLDRGARQVRHLFTMRHDLEVLPAETRVPGLELRPWRKGDAALLAPALLAAYHPEHPDAEEVDLEAAVDSLVGTTEDADNPLTSSATQVALLGGQTMGQPSCFVASTSRCGAGHGCRTCSGHPTAPVLGLVWPCLPGQ